jgi:hypothetical protein
MTWRALFISPYVEEVSIKQLMVCDTSDNGCNTGNMYTAYDWIGENGGVSTMAAYDKVRRCSLSG